MATMFSAGWQRAARVCARRGAIVLACLLELGGFSCVRPDYPIAKPAEAPSAYECDCHFLDREPTLESAHCLHREGDSYRMAPDVVRQVTFDAPAVGTYSQCGVFYVRQDGRAMPTTRFDNGPDEYRDDRVRLLLDGKYGYMNQALEVIVPAQYELTFPYRRAVGAGCMECVFTQEGEHTAVACARCTVLDRDGRPTHNRTITSADFENEYPHTEWDFLRPIQPRAPEPQP